MLDVAAMSTLREFVKFAIRESISKSDRLSATTFDTYCNEVDKSNMNTNQFGDFEFLQYHTYLSTIKSFKAVYLNMTALRKLMTSAHNKGYKFNTHPRYFCCPHKPTPKHFFPLTLEELNKLKTLLRLEIDKIYQREELFKTALKYGNPIVETGAAFKNTVNGTNPVSFWKWQKQLKDCIFQLYLENPKYPNDTTEVQLEQDGDYALIKKIDFDLMNTPYKLIFKRVGIQRLKNSVPFLTDAPHLNFNDILAIIYPRVYEVYIITWAICLESGWSQDMVERIDFKDYLYCPIPIESDFTFIKTTKQKGINGPANIKEAKLFTHPSSKSDPYSAYNLIKLFVERSSRLRLGRNYQKELEDIGSHPFFVYYNDTPGNPILSRHPDRTSYKNSNTKNNYTQRKLGFRFDVRQLRTTCLYLREKEQKLPLIVQVALFGHSLSAVTDEFYKNSSPFQQIRKDDLAKELNLLVETLNDGSFKGTLAPLKQSKKIQDKIITIFSNHSGDSPLATCKDNRNPDWPNNEVELRNSPICRRFNKCLLCSQSMIFSDNIPFIVDRHMYCEQQRRKLRADTFETLYGDEFRATKEVIESWPYRDEILEAQERTIIEGYLLPPIISESF